MSLYIADISIMWTLGIIYTQILHTDPQTFLKELDENKQTNVLKKCDY